MQLRLTALPPCLVQENVPSLTVESCSTQLVFKSRERAMPRKMLRKMLKRTKRRRRNQRAKRKRRPRVTEKPRRWPLMPIKRKLTS